MFILFFQYPVVAFDEWSALTNPFTGTQHGHLRVLLAMGLEEQVLQVFLLFTPCMVTWGSF